MDPAIAAALLQTQQQLQQRDAQMQQMQQHMQQMQQVLQQHEQNAAVAAAAAVAAPGPRIERPKLSAPPRFTGDAVRLDSWLASLEQQFTWYAYAPDHHQPRIALATALLDDPVRDRDWWTHLELAVPPHTCTWQDFVGQLRGRFQPVTAADTAREKLLALKQGRGTVHEYISAFRRLLVSLPNRDSADSLHDFLRGLHPATAQQLRVTGVATLEDAINAAARPRWRHPRGARTAAA